MQFSLEALYNWYRNAIRNPKYRWWVILGTLVYFFSPIDLVPGFLFPGIGQLDDIFLLTIMVTEVSQMAIDGFKKRQSNTTPETAYAEAQTIAV
jgi:uncharacterized membrane protein YkvA (DUF1232 family)